MRPLLFGSNHTPHETLRQVRQLLVCETDKAVCGAAHGAWCACAAPVRASGARRADAAHGASDAGQVGGIHRLHLASSAEAHAADHMRRNRADSVERTTEYAEDAATSSGQELEPVQVAIEKDRDDVKVMKKITDVS